MLDPACLLAVQVKKRNDRHATRKPFTPNTTAVPILSNALMPSKMKNLALGQVLVLLLLLLPPCMKEPCSDVALQ
jgi:hypothetical protein